MLASTYDNMFYRWDKVEDKLFQDLWDPVVWGTYENEVMGRCSVKRL